MKDVYTAHSDWFGCSMGTEEEALTKTLHTFLKLDAYSHHNCSWNATQSYGDRFHQCTGIFILSCVGRKPVFRVSDKV